MLQKNSRITMSNLEKTAFILVTGLIIFTFSFKSFAVSFNCSKAQKRVEQLICLDEKISSLDDAMAQLYKKAMSSSLDKNKLKERQTEWLGYRNECADTDCIKELYETRINQLNSFHNPDIVEGRCRMDSCWWWKIEKTESIKVDNKGELIKVTSKTASEEYKSEEIQKKGYPDLPAENIDWGKQNENFVFCSKTLPAVIESKEEGGGFEAIVINGTYFYDGSNHLYSHICHETGLPSPETVEENLEPIPLNKPTDIFLQK
jgi:uncharacterized protein